MGITYCSRSIQCEPPRSSLRRIDRLHIRFCRKHSFRQCLFTRSRWMWASDACDTSVSDLIWIISTIDSTSRRNAETFHTGRSARQSTAGCELTHECVSLRRYANVSTHPRFSSRWWKVMLWLGSLFVLSGFFLLLIGFLLPRKKINVDDASSSNPPVMIVDRQALDYNAKLDQSHLVGISLVVAGGILFTLSLLLPTFCHMWCASGETNDETDPLKVRLRLHAEQSHVNGGVSFSCEWKCPIVNKAFPCAVSRNQCNRRIERTSRD